MISIKTEKEIQLMKVAGKELARILNMVVKKVKVGIGTKELDELAEKEIRKIGGFPIFKGYQGFTTTLCTCINEEVVHAAAVPDRKLKDGDIFSIDVGMRLPGKGGMVVDMATTVIIGKVPKKTEKLVDVTKKSLELAIKKIKPGIYLGDMSAEVQKYVEKNGFNVVRDLVGHGVGKKLHEDPQVPNYGLAGTGPVLKSGMTLAIEPMVTAGKWRLQFQRENQAYTTVDKSLAAHFEHTVLITGEGAEILTKE
jgi:methionyl aminopeptidase